MERLVRSASITYACANGYTEQCDFIEQREAPPEYAEYTCARCGDVCRTCEQASKAASDDLQEERITRTTQEFWDEYTLKY